MIIAISGKIGSGKDTVGRIIQSITNGDHLDGTLAVLNNPTWGIPDTTWQVKKFAGKLKQIVALLTGCTVEDLESQEFKNKQLPAEWDYVNKWLNGANVSGNHPMNIDTYKSDEVFKGNPKRFIHSYTYRDLLQKIGTEAMRDIIHENIWVNSLFADYKPTYNTKHPITINTAPNWIITDLRFPNEFKAVKDRGGITIRVSRDLPCKICNLKLVDRRGNQCKEITCPLGTKEHESETALDNAQFDYYINNGGTIEELVEDVKIILEMEKII